MGTQKKICKCGRKKNLIFKEKFFSNIIFLKKLDILTKIETVNRLYLRRDGVYNFFP